MAQNAVAHLCEMAPMTKLNCAPFLIIYVLYVGAIFTKVRTLKTYVLKRKIFVFIFAYNFQHIKYKLSISSITYFYTHLFLL